MIRDVIVPGTDAQEWESIRDKIEQRVLASMGDMPPGLPTVEAVWSKDIDLGGLRRRTVHFEAIPGFPTEGTLLLPNQGMHTPPYPAVLCIHGTDFQLAHRNQFSPIEKPNRAYAADLAAQGFATLALDQTGFPTPADAEENTALEQSFCAQYPDWSLDGARLYVQQVGLDLLTEMPEIDETSFGCMGNSLGGRTAIYLAALESRIRAAVASTGISPNITNLFRNQPGPVQLSPKLNAHHFNTGKPLWEYQEMIALAAPRMLCLIEAWNDVCNPMIEPVLECFGKAKEVYRLLNAENRLHLLAHGDGHDTQPEVRAFAYSMLARVLKT